MHASSSVSLPLLVRNEEVIRTKMSREQLAGLYKPENSVARDLRSISHRTAVLNLASYVRSA
jgi:hypothetical protein